MMKKFIIWMYSLILLLSAPQLVSALDTDIYVLTYSQVQIHPDALLILDLSGSMNWTPAGETMYISSSNNCGDNVAYYPDNGTVTKPCTISSSGTVPKYGEATCSGPFYKYSGGDHTTDCSRMGIAKRAIKNVLDDDNNGTVDTADETSLGLRFGFMRFTD
jgi:hypothetical protein